MLKSWAKKAQSGVNTGFHSTAWLSHSYMPLLVLVVAEHGCSLEQGWILLQKKNPLETVLFQTRFLPFVRVSCLTFCMKYLDLFFSCWLENHSCFILPNMEKKISDAIELVNSLSAEDYPLGCPSPTDEVCPFAVKIWNGPNLWKKERAVKCLFRA